MAGSSIRRSKPLRRNVSNVVGASGNAGTSDGSGASASTRKSSYVPPHLRNKPLSAEAPAPFCFLIISGIIKGSFPERPRGGRTVYPLALILSPTRELSMQIHDEAKKFSSQTGVRVVGAYGGAPMHQQVCINFGPYFP
nr:DEAD-box ATP-dependent RNA helicase 37-like [Ipomoea batatas]